jgi:hypothetical protein
VRIAIPMSLAPVARASSCASWRATDGMPTVSRAVAAGVVVVTAALASACRADQPGDATERPAAAAIEWREIGTWSGRLSQQTESFEVSTTPMRLRWQTTSETSPGAGRLTVTLHSTASGRPLATIVDAQGVSSATVNVADEPRWSYFMIDAANVEWEMTLEQAFASAPR